MISIVLDTNVFVAALRSSGGASRAVVRLALEGRLQPLFGNALWSEYQDLLGRPVWGDATSATERQQVLAALARQGLWVTVYYGWRPNPPDEADNHLIELALAGGAHWDFKAVVTNNKKVWNSYLSRIEIDAEKKQKEIFYSCMYRLFIQPSNIADVNGKYRGADDSIRTAKNGEYYSTLSLWDTYRAAHPLYTLVCSRKSKWFDQQHDRTQQNCGLFANLDSMGKR